MKKRQVKEEATSHWLVSFIFIINFIIRYFKKKFKCCTVIYRIYFYSNWIVGKKTDVVYLLCEIAVDSVIFLTLKGDYRSRNLKGKANGTNDGEGSCKRRRTLSFTGLETLSGSAGLKLPHPDKGSAVGEATAVAELPVIR